MDANVAWFDKRKAESVINKLKQHNFNACYVADEAELIERVSSMLIKGETIGIGGSQTLHETGIIDLISNGDYNFLDKYNPSNTPEQVRAISLANFDADTFLMSSNAVTEDGYLFNIDGHGSRVAPMIFGPKRVISIVGINKIVKDLDAARVRVREYASPINAKRLNRKTPCTVTGDCADCMSAERICYDFVELRGQHLKDRFHVIIVGKSFGY